MKKQKENSHEGITWSEMGKQNVQAEKVYLRSYDGNCNENVSLKLNFALSILRLFHVNHVANTAPKKSTERPHYKLHRTKKLTKFHSHLPTTHKTLQSKMSFSKTSKFSAMIPKLNTYFLYHHSFHSNATKT